MAYDSAMHKPTKTKTKPQSQQSATEGESLEPIFDHLSALLSRHAPPFKFQDLGVRNKKSVQLVVPKPVAVPGAYGGKPVELQLAAVILQKGFVGLYLMCIYMNDAAKKELSAALLKLLKGKTCFHVTKLDDSLKNDVEAALELGTKIYRQRGWLE
jgi:hypothetical protein